MTRLHRDYETFSACDIKKQGHHRYARHPSTEALMLGWAFNDDPVQVWDIAGGEPMPKDLAEGYRDPSVLLWAYNAAFERAIDLHVMHTNLPLERYRCCMVLGFSLSLGGQVDHPLGGVARGLEAQVLEMGAPEQFWKDRTGKLLIDRFSKPQPPSRKVKRWDRTNDPEGWAAFKGYCAQDVEAERWLYHRLSAYSPMSDADWSEWHMDQRINERGIPVDLRLIDAALDTIETETGVIMARLRQMTGLANPNSRDQMLGWLQQQGLPLEDLRKETIAKYVQSIEDEEGEDD